MILQADLGATWACADSTQIDPMFRTVECIWHNVLDGFVCVSKKETGTDDGRGIFYSNFATYLTAALVTLVNIPGKKKNEKKKTLKKKMRQMPGIDLCVFAL